MGKDVTGVFSPNWATLSFRAFIVNRVIIVSYCDINNLTITVLINKDNIYIEQLILINYPNKVKTTAIKD